MGNTQEGFWQCEERFGWVLIKNLLKLACTLRSDLNAVPMVLPHHWEKLVTFEMALDGGKINGIWKPTHQCAMLPKTNNNPLNKNNVSSHT